MVTGPEFKHLPARGTNRTSREQATAATFLSLVRDRVIGRFAWASDFDAVLIPLDLPGPEQANAPPEAPALPICGEFVHTRDCRDSWQSQLNFLRDHRQTCWHVCNHGLSCAVVPVVYAGRCLAAIKLVSVASIDEDEFERRIEVLDILAKDFVDFESDFFLRLVSCNEASSRSEPATLLPTDRSDGAATAHVRDVIHHIEDHYTDPRLTIASIARELDVHPDYLSKLFVEQTGQRIKQYLAARRISAAKKLLCTTDWQVKRIAHETGYANPHWFSHLFKIHTRYSPLEYRQRMRDADKQSAN